MSETAIRSSSMITSIRGGWPASLAASRPLSINSFKIADGHNGYGWPICLASSSQEKNSIVRSIITNSRSNCVTIRGHPYNWKMEIENAK